MYTDITRFEAQEDMIYSFWDSLDAQERINWLEPYEFTGKKKAIYKSLDEVLSMMPYLDMKCLSEDILEEVENH